MQNFIETVPKRGYRFAASVKRVASGAHDGGVDRSMLVVLPFENLSAGERCDYFSEGLTEEMITELARLSPERLGVIARTSTMQFNSTTKTIAQIGSDLGVSHVLEGSVRRVGERVRITAQLIRVSDESHLWAQSYERGGHDVLEVQAEVARAVAREIQIKLTPHEKRRLDVDKPRAFEWLERAYREHNPDLIELTREPAFAGPHCDAKFRELVERIGWRSVAADQPPQ